MRTMQVLSSIAVAACLLGMAGQAEAQQYVTILSGLGGVGSSRRGLPSTIPLGGSVWTFALFDQ